jgi:hypothetical protein
MIKGALEVVEDVLRCCEVGFTRAVHVKADLFYCIGDVRSCEGEILESSSQAVVSNRVMDRGTRVGGDLGLSVHRHGVVLVVDHANMLKDI